MLIFRWIVDVAGDGAASDSGDATGGDAVRKRASDDQAAGGNAYSGSTGDTSSGNIVNTVDSDGTITNTGPGTSEYFDHMFEQRELRAS